MDKMKMTYETMLGLAAEMLLDDAILKFRKERLYKAIDTALADGDEMTFKELTNELKSIQAS